MVFSSLYFLFIFLPAFFLCYFLFGKWLGVRAKNAVLFVFSLIFYAWGEPFYVFLLLYSTLIDYLCGRGIGLGDRLGKPWLRKLFLTISLIGNLGVLAVFKYLGFSVATLNSLFGVGLPVPQIALPIGISFFTFQTMSYTIDAYRGKVNVQKNFLDFATFVTMFPQLIAGPVVRYADVEKELSDRHTSLSDVAAGTRRFLVGLAKKVLIANVMGNTVDTLLAGSSATSLGRALQVQPEQLGALGAWVVILSYALQIYFDFSGYSDMAIGLGRIAGFTYPENFRHPYVARSITDFWRRWHITMSSFFRDYVYIPLGGNRVSKGRWLFNIFVVWFLTGLWHGAQWHFVAWGLYFGILLVLEKLFLGKWLEKSRILSHIYALFFIVYGWVIFRCESFAQILSFTKALFGVYGWQGNGEYEISAAFLLRQANVNTVFVLSFLFGVLFCMPVGKWLPADLSERRPRLFACLRAAGDVCLLGLLFLSVVRLANDAYNPFIYFNF